MKRSTLIARWFAIVAFLALLAAATWLILAPADADAQEATPASATLSATAPSDDGLRTLSVDFAPGDSGVAALQGRFNYDANSVTVVSCAVFEAGSCNDIGGEVKFVAFNLGGIRANDQLITVDFVSNAGAKETTTFELIIDIVGNRVATEIDGFTVEPLDLVLGPAERGSLTGEVVEPDTAVGVFGLDVCATHVGTESVACTTTGGRGTWRLDDLATGTHAVSITDGAGTYASVLFDATVTNGEVTAGLSTVVAVAGDDADTPDPDDGDTASTSDETDTTDADAQSDLGAEAAPTSADPTEPALPRDEITADTSDDTNAKVDQIRISYGATIQGAIQDILTAEPLPGINVCATHTVLGHRSCAVTNEAGEFSIIDLSGGNFWITAVDPLGSYENPAQKLIGLNGDNATRTGVVVQMAPR